MKCGLPYICYFTVCFFVSCGVSERKQKKASGSHNKELTKIDSLFQYEKNDAVRARSFEMLELIAEDDYYKKSYLYGYIGKSYKHSFHFDSAVYYTKTAYELSLKLNNRPFQAEQAAWLLKVYSQSETYAAERQKMFGIVNNINLKTLDIPTQALILGALSEFHLQNKREQINLYVSSLELTLLKADILNRTATHNDSLNIALCYIHLCDPYLWRSYISSNNTTSNIEQTNIEKGMRNLLLAREWMGNNKYLLAQYYHRATFIRAIKSNIQAAVSTRDSLVNLAKTTGYNFNDLIIQSNIIISDVHFYFLEKNQNKTDNSWKYYRDAVKYDSNLINPVISSYLQWLKGDLLLRDGKYDSALFTFRKMTGKTKMFSLSQLISYNISMAECHEKLDNLDSAIFYCKKYTLYTDSLITVNEKEIIADIEYEYHYKITQDKIAIKNLIIANVHKQRLWLFTGAASLLCLSVLLIVIYRNKRKAAIKLDTQNAALLHLNQQLEEANYTKAKLFGIISHDFRAPISQIYQLFKLQQSQSILIEAEEKAELEKQIQIATSNLLDNMEDLLIWSKTQMQLFNIVKEQVDIAGLCNQCISLMKNFIQDKQLLVMLHIPPGSMLKTDSNFLLAILRNILHNAIKASPEKGVIEIRYEQSGNHKASLKVINQGPLFTQQNYLEALHLAHTSRLLASGLGFLIIDELSSKIGAEVFFEKTSDGETSCNLQFAI